MARIISVRASSFGTLFDCAMRFEGEQIMRIFRPSSLRAWLGTSIHAGTAAFDQAALDGEPITADAAADVLQKMFWEPSQEVDFADVNLSRRDAEKIGIKLLTKYCVEVAPRVQYESVEMPLAPLDIDCGEGLTIRLTGTMDRARVVRLGADKIIADLKTGGRLIGADGTVAIKGRAAQLGTYQLLSEHTDGEPTGGAQIIALQTTARAETGISRIFDARKQMLGTEGTDGYLERAAKIFKSGDFHPNPQSSLCDKRYCARWATCIFHE